MAEAQPIVLLVEDNDLLRNLLSRMLADHGFPAIVTENAEEGLLAFESNPTVLLAILDMVLPGQSGLDLAAELERRRPGLRILYISGLSDSIAMESIARRAPELVLFKPFGEAVFIQRVTTLLRSNVARAVPGRAITVTSMPPSLFPWDRLLEASDKLDVSGTGLLSYRDTTAGFAMAVTHIAVLRAARLPYAFRFTGNSALPVCLMVSPDNWMHALDLIERIGLGADIAVAA